jgi:ribosomal protein RSM22 (predicted rRNA methylase)
MADREKPGPTGPENGLEGRLNLLAEVAHGEAIQLGARDLTGRILELSQGFTSKKGERRKNYLADPGLLAAYVGYFAPLNVARLAFLLRALQREGHLDGLPPAPDVVDLGSGPFVGLLAALIHFSRLGRALAVDGSGEALKMGRTLFETTLREVGGSANSLHHVRADLRGPPSRWKPHSRPDLIIAANVLNEVARGKSGQERSRWLLNQAIKSLRDGGHLLVVEPGTRLAARGLQVLRDALFSEPRVAIVSPCTGAARCPLSQSGGSWCFAEFAWRRPDALRRLDQKTGFDKKTLHLSHLLLKKAPAKAYSSRGLRVVGGVMESDGAVRRYVCSARGRQTLKATSPEGAKVLHHMRRGAWQPDTLPAGVQLIKEKRTKRGRFKPVS